MAKELPYFQFEPAEYLTRDVSFCSLSAQGLFINICAFYWQRNCELTKSQILRRFNNEPELTELISEGVIDLEGDKISIKFLDIQRFNAINKSSVNSVNGAKGGRPKKPTENPNKTEIKANENPNESETKGIRKDNIKKEEIKKENIIKEVGLSAAPPEKINYESFINFFNGTCTNFPNVKKITENRKKAISVILKKFTKQEIAEALRLANKSDFLNGDNQRGWKADFDFIIKENSITKILEGSYEKTKRNNTKGATGDELKEIIAAHFRD